MWQEAELSLSAPQGDVELDRCTPPPQDVTSLGVIGGPCALKCARARGRGERELEYELRPCQHTHARFDGIEQPSASRPRPPLAELSRLVAAGNAVAREEVSALDVDRCALAVRAWCALGDAIAGDTRIRPRSVSNS